MMTSECCNDIVLEGKVLTAPALSHENHGVRFFRFFLEVPRLSGQADTLPLLIPEPMVQQVCQGDTLRLRGQLRSFNNRSGVGSRLVQRHAALLPRRRHDAAEIQKGKLRQDQIVHLVERSLRQRQVSPPVQIIQKICHIRLLV